MLSRAFRCFVYYYEMCHHCLCSTVLFAYAMLISKISFQRHDGLHPPRMDLDHDGRRQQLLPQPFLRRRRRAFSNNIYIKKISRMTKLILAGIIYLWPSHCRYWPGRWQFRRRRGSGRGRTWSTCASVHGNGAARKSDRGTNKKSQVPRLDQVSLKFKLMRIWRIRTTLWLMFD